MIKEQLRIKEKELHRRDAEQEKHDTKIKHVLKLSQDKIEDLKTTVKKQEEEIKDSRSSKPNPASNAKTEAKIKELKSQLETAHKEKGKLAEDLKKSAKAKDTPAPAPKEVVKKIRDPKIVKALKKLKLKNDYLSKEKIKIQAKDDKEKELLNKEIKTLKKEYTERKGTQTYNDKTGVLEEIIQEKNDELDSYKKQLKGNKSAEIIDELKAEKTVRDKELADHKTKFQEKIKAETTKIETKLKEELGNPRPVETKGKEVGAKGGEEGSPAWMATFADMMSLLLTFFILMYAIASQNTARVLHEVLGIEEKSLGVIDLIDEITIKKSLQELTGLNNPNILDDMDDIAEDSAMAVDTNEAKVVVRVPGANLFKPGQADLQLSGRPVLDEVIAVIRRYPDYKIHIQGHTDDDPISTEKFPTNWELSAARATAVLRYFFDKGVEPEKMTATGYADTFPLASNDTDQGRNLNRRVEFVLEKEN
jgi:chemotaxis protein MotB